MKRIFITGATGRLGRELLKVLAAESYIITLGGRKRPEELAQYDWVFFDLENSDNKLNLEGFDIIIHLASNTEKLSADSDLKGIQKIVKSLENNLHAHLIYVSIVGVEKAPIKYFKTKRKVEEYIIEKCARYSILRSTQFLAFFEDQIKAVIKRKIAIIPNLQYQPIEAAKVAERLVELCKNGPINAIEKRGGSEVVFYKQAIKAYFKTRGLRRLIISIPNVLLGSLGNCLTTEHGIAGSNSWISYLEEKYGAKKSMVLVLFFLWGIT